MGRGRYRLDLCLFYAPHVVAIAVVMMAGVYHDGDMDRWFRELKFKPEHAQQIKAPGPLPSAPTLSAQC